MKKIILGLIILVTFYFVIWNIIFIQKYSARPCYFNEKPKGLNWTVEPMKDIKTGIVFGEMESYKNWSCIEDNRPFYKKILP